MGDRQRLREELERKKIYLAQMKEDRERRSRMNQNVLSPQFLTEDRPNENADDILRAFGLSNLSRASTAPSTVSALHRESPTTNLDNQTVINHPDQSNNNESSVLSKLNILDRTYLSDVKQQQQPHSDSVRTPKQIVQITQTSIPLKEKVLYTKATQTLDSTTQTTGELPHHGNKSSQQSNYYGKQTDPKISANKVQHQAIPSNQYNKATTTNFIQQESPRNNNQLPSIGTTHLGLEWDDEFSGMFRDSSQNLWRLRLRVNILIA